MNQTKLWSAVALSTTTVLGLSSVGRAATPNQTTPTQPPAPSGDAVNAGNSQSSRQNLSSGAVVVTQIHAHNLAGRQAATLYVRNIPFLTFVGTSQEAGADISNLTEKANVLAAKINQLISDKVDANQISVSWKAGEQKGDRYIIKVNGEELVEIDGNTRLPDTTNNLSQDALQATNRLRRLIGGVAPLRQINNIAEKQQQQTAKQPQQTAKKQQQVAKQAQQTTKKPQQTVKQSQQNTAKKVRGSSRGMASYYGNESGSRTATGERFNPHGLTAAHRTLPLGTKVRVINNYNGRSVVLRVNDRGPFVGGRIIDVSLGAAKQLGMISSGVASVTVEVLGN